MPENEDKYKVHNIVTLLFLSTITIAFVIVAEILQDDIMEESIELSITLQEKDLKTFSLVISHIIFYALFAYVPLSIIIRKSTSDLFLTLFQFGFSLYLYGLLKLIYRSPRPSHLDNRLLDDDHFCEPDYGNPSGHAFLSMIIMLIAASDFSRSITNLLYDILIHIPFIAFSIVVCFTRLYYGVHSIDQVILGVLFAFTFHFIIKVFRNPLKRIFIDPILDKDDHDRKKIVWTYVILIIVVNVIIYVAWGIVYAQEQKDDYFDFIVHCREFSLSKYPNFSTRLLGDTLINNYSLGLLFGMSFAPQNIKLGWEFIYDKHVGWFIARFLVFAILFGLSQLAIYPRDDYVWLTVIRFGVIQLAVGIIQGRFTLSIFDLLRIKYQKEDTEFYDNDIEIEGFK